ncbi:MAG: hypothetical protein ABEN55_14405, partial [Bradymonadaceae bacterium]
MDEADDNGNDEKSDGWLAAIGELGSGLASGIGELVVGKEDLAVIGRWRPVLGAGRKVLASFGRLG